MSLSYNDKVLRSLFLGFIRLHILYHASKEAVFGLSLIKELGRHGYQMSPGTLYPILHQMESNGFLFSKRAVVNTKMRKYYRTTEEGMRALSQSYEKIKELSNELNEPNYAPIAMRMPSAEGEHDEQISLNHQPSRFP